MNLQLHKPPFLLKEMKIEVTQKCPLVCAHCSSNATPNATQQMKVTDALHLTSQAINIGIKELDISGGEPLIWPGIIDLVKMCSENGVKTSVYSSGNVRDCQIILAELRKVGLSKIIFSIFGSSAHTHEQITRIRGSFLQTMSSIDRAISERIKTEIHFVPLSTNYMELPKVIDLAKDRNIKKISVLRFVPQGRGALGKDLALTKPQNIRLKQMIEDGRERIEIRAGSPYNFLFVNDSPKCNAAIDRLIIGPDFHVYPCDAFKQIRSFDVVGSDMYSRLDKYSLKDCWEKSPYLNAIRNYLTTEFATPCSGCSDLQSCLSGCIAQKVIHNGDLGKCVDPMCLLS